MPDVSLNGIEFTIKGSADEASASIDSLIESLNKLAGALGNVVSKSNLKSVGKKVKEALAPLSEELQDVIRNADKVDVLKAKLGSLSLTLEDAFKSGNLDKAWSIKGQILSTAAALEKATGAANQTQKSIKNIGDSAKRANSPLKNFVSSIKRIAMYRIIRSIIKEITEAIKEGAKNFYDFSKAAGAPFAAAMDGVKASAQQMKNQLGAAFGTLFTTIAPILNNLISLVTKFANVLTMIFARLGGASGWYRATEASADAISDVGGAAREAMKYLAPFDELNRLPDERGGGGGGSGNNGGDYEWVPFEQFDIGDGLASIVQWFTDAFNGAAEWIEEQDWLNLASNIITKIGEAFEKIDWAGLAQSISRFIGAALGAVAGLLVGALADLVTGISDKIYEAFHNDDGTRKTGEEIWNGIKEGIVSAITNVWQWIKDNIVTPFVSGFKKAFGIASPATEMVEPGKYVGEGILEGIKKPFENIKNWVKENILNPLKEQLENITNNPTVKVLVNLARNAWTSVKKWITDKFMGGDVDKKIGVKRDTSIWKNIGSWITNNFMGDTVSKAIGIKRDTSIWSNVGSWISNNWLGGSVFSKVSLKRNDTPGYSWASVAKWIDNNYLGGFVQMGVQLVRSGWTYVNNWLQQFIGNRDLEYGVGFVAAAKGGIVSRATLFGGVLAGEAGAEAIIPLERNTEWVGMVASGLVQELAKASGNNENGSMADAMYIAFSRALAENSDDRDIVLDGDVVYRKMVQRNRRETYRSGVNPLASMG